MAAFGQTEFGQYHIWPKSTGRIWPTLFGRIGPIFVDRIWPDRIWPFFFLGGGPKRWGPEGVGGPKFRAFFSLSPPEMSFFLLSLGGLLVEFWWCLKRRDAQMCTFGVGGPERVFGSAEMGTSVETPAVGLYLICVTASQSTTTRCRSQPPLTHSSF